MEYHEVKAAVQRLWAQGVYPSKGAVREALGGGSYQVLYPFLRQAKQELGIPAYSNGAAEEDGPAIGDIEAPDPLEAAQQQLHQAQDTLKPLEEAVAAVREPRTEALRAWHAAVGDWVVWERLGAQVPDEEPLRREAKQRWVAAETAFKQLDRQFRQAQDRLVVPRRKLAAAQAALALAQQEAWLAQHAPDVWHGWQDALAAYQGDPAVREVWRHDAQTTDRANGQHRERLQGLHRALVAALDAGGQGACLIPLPMILLNNERLDDRRQVAQLAGAPRAF